jgi:2-desacetyl-2-hydroxyethyl bacteriochlorophyllide A dehydrogenase
MEETMRAAVFEGPGRLVLKDVPVPVIERPDQIIIQVDAVSICGTDVHITNVPPGYAATPGTILGHELAGTVYAKGEDVTYLEIGDRVVVNPNNYCGTCYYCRRNLPNECLHIEPLGIDYDGAFAKFCRVAGKVAYKISPDVSPDVASMAEPLACAINGMNKISVSAADGAVVIGCGPIGLILAMLLRAQGASPIVLLETSEFRAAFAREKLGFDCVLNPIKDDVPSRLAEIMPYGAKHVFDVTGSQAVPAVQYAAMGGNVVLFGVNKSATDTLAQHFITTKEIAVRGTWLANATFPAAVEVIEKQSIPLEKLITEVLPLDQVHEGLKLLAQGKAIKVIIRP